MSPEIENAAKFLKAALRDGPRRVTDVLHDACIYQIPVEVLIQGLDALDIRWQQDEGGLEYWAMPCDPSLLDAVASQWPFGAGNWNQQKEI